MKRNRRIKRQKKVAIVQRFLRRRDENLLLNQGVRTIMQMTVNVMYVCKLLVLLIGVEFTRACAGTIGFTCRFYAVLMWMSVEIDKKRESIEFVLSCNPANANTLNASRDAEFVEIKYDRPFTPQAG